MTDNPESHPTVSLGGKDWEVPPLSARRIIKFGAMASSVANITNRMPESDMMTIYEAIFVGVSQGFKNGDAMTFEKWLDEYHIVFDEIIAALPVISKQAGMQFERKAAAAGETLAEPNVERPSSTTGMTS